MLCWCLERSCHAVCLGNVAGLEIGERSLPSWEPTAAALPVPNPCRLRGFQIAEQVGGPTRVLVGEFRSLIVSPAGPMASLASFSRLAASTYSSACSIVSQAKIAISCHQLLVGGAVLRRRGRAGFPLKIERGESLACRQTGLGQMPLHATGGPRLAGLLRAVIFAGDAEPSVRTPRRAASCGAQAGLASVATGMALAGPNLPQTGDATITTHADSPPLAKL
jgi:hypothetical protein